MCTVYSSLFPSRTSAGQSNQLSFAGDRVNHAAVVFQHFFIRRLTIRFVARNDAPPQQITIRTYCACDRDPASSIITLSLRCSQSRNPCSDTWYFRYSMQVHCSHLLLSNRLYSNQSQLSYSAFLIRTRERYTWELYVTRLVGL